MALSKPAAVVTLLLDAAKGWLPVFAAMPKMVNELCADPSLGLLARPSTYMSGRVFLLVPTDLAK